MMAESRGIKSVMDVLNLWKDDPEEILLELGFGCDEPDLSGRIPARFINYKSQARGINLQVFLDAQRNRIDLENPDVSNRFRQVEVLQQVTTTLRGLVISSTPSSLRAPSEKMLSPEARERRRRMASLFRRATKKSLNQNHAYKTQDITSPAPVTSDSVTPELPQHAASPENEKIKCLSPVTDERENNPKFTIQPHPDQNQQLRPGPLGEDVSPVKASASVKRKSLANGAPPDSEKRSVMSESSPSGQRDFSPHLTSTTLDHLCVDDSSSYSDKPPSPALESEPPTQYIVLRSSSPELQDNSEYQLPPSSSPTDFLSQSSPVMSSTPSDSSNRSPANPQSKNAIPVLPENPLRLPGTPLTLISTPTRPPPPASLDLHCTNPHLSSYGSESLSQSSENQKTSDPHDFSLLENHNNSTQQLSKDISIPTAPVSKSSKCDNDCQGLYFCSNATHSANRSNSPFAVDSSTSDSVLPTRPNSPAHQNHPNTCICSSPASPALDDPILSSLSDDTVLSDGSDLIEPPTNPPFKLDDEIPSEPYRPSLGPSNLEDNGSILSCLSYGKVLLGLGLTDNPTDPSLKLDRNLSFAPTTNISKDCPHLSNGSVNSLESSLMKKPINPYFQLDKDSPSATSAPGLDSYSSPILSCPFPETSDPVCPHVAEENNSDPREESRYNKDQSCLLRDDLDPTPSSVLDDDDDEQVDWLIIEPVNTRESHGEAVCFSDINHSSSVCETTETDTLVISLCLRDEAEADHRQTEEINDTSSQSGEVNELPMICSRTDVTGMESLDVVFDTSVDGFESENGDMDDFFQQLDNEGRVYWAEPILVSDSSYTLKETHSFDESPRDSLLSRSSVSLDSFLSLALPSTNQTTEDPVVFVDTSSSTVVKDLVPSQSITSDTKRTSRSVSVQMSSSLSSHIVHRKDIPYVTDSKPTPLPSAFSLDTSSPLRAVQSWTDLQIQRRNQKLPERALTLPHEADIPEGRAGKAQRSRMVYSSSPSFPLLPNHSRLQDRLPGIATNYRTVSVSVDTGLGPDKEEEMYRKGNGKSHLWEGNRSVSVACCCSCDHQSHYCADGSYRKQHVLENGPYSLGDLEEMMLWLQQYCSVHSNMEEELSENRASVYTSLSDLDREKIEDLEALRQAVKLEAVELETQLKQLAHHCDESLKMKMRRLLDEQSLLCTQLRVSKPAALDVSSSKSTPSRTVATQCSLLPRTASADMQSY